MEHEIVLTMRGICMEFPGVKALDHVDFTLRKGRDPCLDGRERCGQIHFNQVPDRYQRFPGR